jgi:CRP/FNR family transcriptional regulator, cyclic AMP receptor protein
MTITPADLRTIPLFREITDAHLVALMAAFEKQIVPAGETLFAAGALPTRFLMLARGEVLLHPGPGPGEPALESSEGRYALRGVAPIGELGALTGIPRNTSAVTSTEVEIWSIEIFALLAFFERHGEIAFPFYHSLLKIVSDKVRRDRRRIDDMRANIVRTQKAMKKLRDLVLEAGETPLSSPIFEVLDELIEKNRRSNYRVSPSNSLTACVRFDDGSTVPVLDISEGYIKLVGTGEGFERSAAVSFVLVLPSSEIPVSGTVERISRDGAVVKLDLMIEKYRAILDNYVTRLQMLDYVV